MNLGHVTYDYESLLIMSQGDTVSKYGARSSHDLSRPLQKLHYVNVSANVNVNINSNLRIVHAVCFAMLCHPVKSVAAL